MGRRATPRRSSASPSPSTSAWRATISRHRFPALADAPLVGHRACQYEITPDMHFVMAPHPDHDGRVWLLGGGSGHGFKHGPALAERFEPWLRGAAEPEPRFGLGDARAATSSLRTAGVRTALDSANAPASRKG